MAAGDVKSLIARIQKDIRTISDKPGWRNYWEGDGYTPDYSEIRIKMESLLKAGHADAVVTLGKDLIHRGYQQVEQSDDDGETASEIEECTPILVKALERSSLKTVDKLAWAVDVARSDDLGIFDAFGDYLLRSHEKSDWNLLANRLMKQLAQMKHDESQEDFHRNYTRYRLADWIIHALGRAGRNKEIIPLCEAEAPKTGSYTRLVKHLISAKRYAEAEQWIQEGIRMTEGKWAGIASDLRHQLKEIYTIHKNWPAIALMQVEEFVRYPSEETFSKCQKTGEKTKTWPKVRDCLLAYLEKGTLPWKQKTWPLPQSKQTDSDLIQKNRFPLTMILIHIAILEKDPKRVLFWNDQLQKNKTDWSVVGNDPIAVALQDYAPDRAVSIWKNMAESLISQTNPQAYEQAASYLRKAEKVMTRAKKQAEWKQYWNHLKKVHTRKRRLIDILNRLNSRPILRTKQ